MSGRPAVRPGSRATLLSQQIISVLAAEGPLSAGDVAVRLWLKVPAEKALRKAEYRRAYKTPGSSRRLGDPHSLDVQRIGARAIITDRLAGLVRNGVVERVGNLYSVPNRDGS